MPVDSTPSPRVPTVEILTVGDELLAGDLVDTNTAFLADRCRVLGLQVMGGLTLRDRVDELVPALQAIAARADVCLVSGGLGPTRDDLTAEAVARAAGVSLRRDEQALRDIEAKFAAFGRPMAPVNAKQADLPAGCDRLDNPVGTAPGFAVELDGCLICSMPGVPRELKQMMREKVEPRLSARHALTPVPRRIYRTLGRGESSIASEIEPLLDRARERSPGLAAMFVHYRASTPEVSITLEATPDRDGNRATADELADLDGPLAEVLRPALYGIGAADLPTRVVRALDEAKLKLTAAESCTGGGVARLLTGVPGASAVFDGGLVAYANRIKRDLLGVPADALETHGAVSEPVARAMAVGARDRFGADLGVAISGIAGPDGGTPEKPVGTVHIAVSSADGIDHRRLALRGNRGTVQKAASAWALKLVWDHLVERGTARLTTLD